MIARGYIQPKSMTWLAGVSAILVGAAQIAGLAHPSFGAIAEILSLVTGGVLASSPAQLVAMGFGLIGLGAKLERAAK